MSTAEVLKGLRREHVLAALRRLNDGEEIPKKRGSTKYCLVEGGRHYPPKWVIHLACEEARTPIGKRRGLELFGGPMTNDPLMRLGFIVEECPNARLHPHNFGK